MSEPAPIDQNFWRVGNPVLWGLLFSVVLIGGFGWMFSLDDCGQASCETNWDKLLASSPNEIGDTLAGLAGSLAFLWIIVTVMLQSQELREQRKELRLQRDEFEGQRKASQEMAKAMIDQTKFYEDEQIHREEERAAELFVQKLKWLLHYIHELKNNGQWRHDDLLIQFVNPIDTSGDEAMLCQTLLSSVVDCNASFHLTDEMQREPLSVIFESALVEIQRTTSEISDLFSQLSKGQKQRYKNLKLEKTGTAIEMILRLQNDTKNPQQEGKVAQ